MQIGLLLKCVLRFITLVGCVKNERSGSCVFVYHRFLLTFAVTEEVNAFSVALKYFLRESNCKTIIVVVLKNVKGFSNLVSEYI